MASIIIKASNRRYYPQAWVDMPATEQREFDYIHGHDQWMPRFVKYKGRWHDMYVFTVLQSKNKAIVNRHPDPINGWHGYFSDTYYGGVLIRHVGDSHVLMGTYYV